VQASRPGRVLNLCFHGIGPPRRELEPGEAELRISPAQFEELLDVIVRVPALRLTFDDGNASDAEFALPALVRRHLTAAFFIISGRIGQPFRRYSRCILPVSQSGKLWTS
jgi:hypothetical protein